MNKLKQYRKAAGLTQSEVAERLGVTQETVASHEIGRRGISAAMLAQYAALYTCKMDDLYSGVKVFTAERSAEVAS